MVNYYSLGGHKRLHEIVVAGSHDAGITGGGKHVKTQSTDIGGQARAGVRVFDLRVAAAKGPAGRQHKRAELRAFHADPKLMTNETKTRHLKHGGVRQITRTKLSGGAFGLGLSKMLRQARRFVESANGQNEFLILKFDKCLNWEPIAELCIQRLGDRLYRGRGSLNTATLDDLRGRVVVVFSGNGLASLHGAYGPDDGILGFRNLQSGGGYEPNFDGLQYYGKGGTSPWNPHKKIRQNEKKQRKLMNEAKAVAFYQSPEVVGMMYWTTTGLTGSIRTRNRGMWTRPNRARFRKLWAQGLDEWTEHVNPLAGLDGGATTHRFMPNIVMIDFPHPWRCQKIRDLNDLSPRQIQRLANTP